MTVPLYDISHLRNTHGVYHMKNIADKQFLMWENLVDKGKKKYGL